MGGKEALGEGPSGPVRVDEIGEPDAHEEVALWRREEDTGFVDNDPSHGKSVPKPEFLRLGGQLIERGPPLRVAHLLVGQQVGDSDTPVTADHAVWDLPVVEQGDLVRSGHPEQFRRLLRRELCLRGHQGHGVAVGHLPQDLHQQVERLARHRQRNEC